jgi:hypothetical protein
LLAWFSIAPLLLVMACGESRHSNDGGSADADGAGAVDVASPPDGMTADNDGGTPGSLSQEEQTAFGAGGGAVSDAVQVLALMDSMVSFGLTLDPTGTAASNASSIGNQASQSLGGCGTFTVGGTSVQVDFGTAGCTLQNGQLVTGQVELDVTGGSPDGTTSVPVMVAISFAQVTVGSRGLSGTIMLAASGGSSVTVGFDVTVGSQSFSGSLMASGTAMGSFTVTGMLTLGSGTTTTQLNVNSVTYQSGDCYPDGGTISLTKGPISETVTFSSASAQSGQVSVQVGRLSTQATLPSYGSCPAS